MDEYIEKNINTDSKLYIIDEISEMELCSKNFKTKVEDLLKDPEKIVIASIDDGPSEY